MSQSKIISQRHLRRKVKINVDRVFRQFRDTSNYLHGPTLACNAGKSLISNNIVNSPVTTSVIRDKDITLAVSSNQEQNLVASNYLSPINVFVDNSASELPDRNLNNEITEFVVHSESNESTLSSYLEENQKFLDDLKNWCRHHNVTHACLSELLGLLKSKFPFLPRDPRTMLNTPKCVPTVDLENGQMIYLGISNALKYKLDVCDANVVEILCQFNIDGIPVYKSSSTDFWPILGRCVNLVDTSPFCVAIFCGVGKPNPLSAFLSDFIKEVKLLNENGLVWKSKHYSFKIDSFACDAPARAYVKQIMGHNSTFPCERCTIQAQYANKRHFLPVERVYKKRKDSDFYTKKRRNKFHIKDFSPLININVGLVSQFVLDPMHAVYLGVTRRLVMNYLIEGKRPHKISCCSQQIMNKEINKFKIPYEFPRKIRSFKDIRRWKATEFRFFVLYCGVVVLKSHLREETFKHFLLLHAAVFILANRNLCHKMLDISEKYICQFVQECPKIYDEYFVTYNVHSLTHICDDVRLYGPIDHYSCFPFENYLGGIKKQIRGQSRPLQQIYNRLQEFEGDKKKHDLTDQHKIRVKNIYDAENNCFRCSELRTPKFRLTLKWPNNIVCVGKRIYIIKSMHTVHNNEYRCIGIPFRYLHNLYKYPCPSSVLNIYYASGYGNAETFSVKDISYKCVTFHYKQGMAVFPMLHLFN